MPPPMASSTIEYRPAMLSARLTDIELVGKVEKKRKYFVVVHVDERAVAKSAERYGLAPRWQEDYRIEFHPSSTITFKLFRCSIFPLRGPYEIGLHECKVTKLLENNTVTTMLDLTEDNGGTSLATLNVKFSLLADHAKDIVRRVDANLARSNDKYNVLTSASGNIDDAIARAQTGGGVINLLQFCEPLRQALEIFVYLLQLS